MIRQVAFDRRKYGPELLVDVGRVRDLFAPPRDPHRLDFYDIVLVTAGRGAFDLDDRRYRVAPGVVLCTAPGQTRRWRVRGLDGLVLFFTAEFVAEFFNDPRFLRRLGYFHRRDVDQALALTPRRAAGMRRRLERMAREVRRLRPDSPHLLRALLYGELLTLQRAWATGHGGAEVPAPSSVAERFQDLVEQRFRREHGLASYARDLNVSASHLRALTRRHFGQSAKEIVMGRLLLEAKRLLWYTDQTAAQVAFALGFEDPAYFSRFFRRYAGTSPGEFRRGAGATPLLRRA